MGFNSAFKGLRRGTLLSEQEFSSGLMEHAALLILFISSALRSFLPSFCFFLCFFLYNYFSLFHICISLLFFLFFVYYLIYVYFLIPSNYAPLNFLLPLLVR